MLSCEFASALAYLTRNLRAFVALDLIASLDVVVITHANAAFGAGTDLADVVLEAAQGLQLPLVDDDVVAQHANRIAAPNIAVDHHATRDVAELRRAEHLAHLRETDDLLAHFGRQQPARRGFDVVDRLVNDAVVADIDAAFLDRRLALPRRRAR